MAGLVTILLWIVTGLSFFAIPGFLLIAVGLISEKGIRRRKKKRALREAKESDPSKNLAAVLGFAMPFLAVILAITFSHPIFILLTIYGWFFSLKGLQSEKKKLSFYQSSKH